MPQVILTTYSTDSNFNGDCDYAVVNLDPQTIKTIMQRIRFLSAVHSEDNDLFKMVYWSGHADYFSYAESIDGLLETVSNEGFIVMTERAGIPEEAIARVECSQMVIFSDGVSWRAIPKHSSIYVETERISLETLEQISRENG